MTVPLFDLTRQYEAYHQELEAAALRVLRSGRYVLGDEVEAFEHEVAEYLGCHHVIGLSSGTDAILAALMMLDVGPGDKVVLPAYTFFATAGVVARLGAQPVLVDVEPTWGNMDPEALDRLLATEDHIKAAIFVHLFGSGAGIGPIAELLAVRNIPLIEDAAQAIGSRADGRFTGTIGLAGCFSTFPTKNLGGVGDGGFLTTDNTDFAERVRRARMHGQTGPYDHQFVGGNFRLDPLQAACLRVKLRHLEKLTEKRRANAARYRELFAQQLPSNGAYLPIDIPDRHTYHQYVIYVAQERRDPLRKYLTEHGIGNSVYYPLPLHLQPCFANLGYNEGDFPTAEHLARTNIALPIFPELQPEEQEAVVAAVAAGLQALS